MAMSRRLLAAGLLFTAAAGSAQPVPPALGARPPRYVEPAPYDFAAHTGWQAMFDGHSLRGWEGQTDAWRVEDGAIVSSSDGQGVAANAPVYLFWAGGNLADFEFKTEIKLEGEKANSGVQFRALLLGKTDKPNSEWESFGYQADFDFANTQTGALIECCAGPRRGPRPRQFRAGMGMALHVAPAGADGSIMLASIGNRADLERSIKVGDWNELHLVARGHTLFYYLNGRLMSVVTDDDPQRFIASGRLAIQLEGSGARKVSYRNLWLKVR
jgi:hypothetical protein